MIVSLITGGLGNQLSMYSFGRAFAERHDREFKVDTIQYKSYKLHKYVLNKLSINPVEVQEEELVKWTEDPTVRVLSERVLRYDESIWNCVTDNAYINIYASDYRYSKPIIEKLRKELNPLVRLTGYYADLYDEMRDGETVSMHVRLQDYARNPNCLNLPLSYYCDAYRVIKNVSNKLRVYLFTDEPEIIIKGGFTPGFPFTIISNGPEKNLEDMSLMTACKHHVVANSSYSFWGAWLDGKGGGITVVPDLYHRPDCKQIIETYGQVIQPQYPPDWNVVKVRYPQSQT